MTGLLLLLASAAPSAEVRLAVEAAPTEVLVANPSCSVAVFSIRASGYAAGWFLLLDAGVWVGIPVPPDLETSGIVFDFATPEGIAVSDIPLFAEGAGRLRRSLVLCEPESSFCGLAATELEVGSSTSGSEGSSWNLTIGPPPSNPKVGDLRSGFLLPTGVYSPEPASLWIGGYHSPL